MKEKRISKPTPEADVPYDVANAGDVAAFCDTATKHRGVEELRAKRGRPPKAETDRKEQIALRLDADACVVSEPWHGLADTYECGSESFS